MMMNMEVSFIADATDTIFVSDMDGTLTPARLPMTKEFAEVFEKFVKNHVFYIVSGSDFKKVCEQIPESIRNNIDGIYCSLGNELYVNGHVIYQNDFIPEELLIKKLEYYRQSTRYPHELYQNYIEVRRGMINFSVLGRDCPREARSSYKEWDSIHNERKMIAKELSELYPQYDISIGGNISIDIVPNGFGKDQVADILRKKHKTEKIVFFGDRIEKGGNDYSLANHLMAFGNACIIPVDDPSDVLKVLKTISD
jgi:phosphomannomutase